MARNEQTTGIGLRQVRLALRDDDGSIKIPAGQAVGTPYPGVQISGAQALTLNIPDSQRVTATGDDRAYYTFTLPPTENPTGELRVSKTDMAVLALLTSTKVFGSPVTRRKVGLATDKQGLEEPVMLWGSRQAVDTEEGSAYFGQTVWQTYVILNAIAAVRPATMEYQNIGQVSYAVTANDATVDEFGGDFTELEHGFTKSSYLMIVTLGMFFLDAFEGDDNQVDFTLTHPPTSVDVVVVYVAGEIIDPADITLVGSVVTLATAPGDGDKVVIEYEY
jgi:hypothetical protein